MTLQALVKNIAKSHTPAPEVHVVDYVFHIKGWLEPFLNKIKNHVYPHTYRFFKRNGRVSMKYKNWASDKTWLPDGAGLCMLNSTPRGIPPLVRPETKKQLDVKDLQDCINKCKRLTNEDKLWWSSFVSSKKVLRDKWSTASANTLKEEKRLEWPLNKLKRHRAIKEAAATDPDQQQREETLANLLRKADHFPSVSILLSFFNEVLL